MSDIICTNCRGQSTSGCWLCNPPMHQGQPIDPITKRIHELEAENARLKTCLVEAERQYLAQFVHINAALGRAEAAEAKVARLRGALQDYATCCDGCTCGDGWSHNSAIAALSDEVGE